MKKIDNKFIKFGKWFNICIIIVCSFVIFYKGASYKNLNKEYEMQKIIVNKNINSKVNIYYDNSNEEDKITGIEKTFNCYKSNDDDITLDDDISSIINDISNLFNEDNNYFSFYYKDLFSGFALGYNEEASIWGASTVKAPLVIYIYEEASKGNINLDKKLTYTKDFYLDGTGYIQYDEIGSEYSIRELCKKAIIDSDNIAYIMLLQYIGIDNVYKWWSKMGTNDIFKNNNAWSDVSSLDAYIYMNELYEFYRSNDTYGNEIMSYFKSAAWKPIKGINDSFEVANKSGWSSTIFHDASIIFDENPYILVILSNTGESDYEEFFNESSQLFGKLHNAYWEYKKNKCIFN